MLQRFWRLYASPVFDGDEEKTRMAQVLNAILWSMIFILVLMLPLMPFFNQPVIGAVVMIVALSLTVVGLNRLRAGHVRSISYGLTSSMWVVCVVIVAISGGIYSPETTGFLVVVLIAGMLLGMQMAWMFFGLSMIAVVSIALIDLQGVLPDILFVQPWLGMLLILVNIALGTDLLWLASSDLNKALQRSRQSVRELESERATLEQRVEERTHSVDAARLEAEDARIALESQVWQANGLVLLNEVLRGEQSLSRLAGRATQAICQHIGASIGALYLLEKDTLFLCGGYATSALDNPPRFLLGEGLVGQAAIDKEPIVLTDVPVEYLSIRSGLGFTQPNQVVVWPLSYHQQVVGVLEVGLLTPFTEAQRYFFESATEALTTALQTVQARQRVDELLAETQAQSRELQSREEELRTINKRLIAQAERLETHS